MAVLDIEASVEATPAAKRISRTQKSKLHRTPLAASEQLEESALRNSDRILLMLKGTPHSLGNAAPD